MSLGILTNVAATYAENNLNKTQGSLQTVLQQLSSGSRINSGADDAAGLSVADGLHANEAALTQSAQNAQNGVGFLAPAAPTLAHQPGRAPAIAIVPDVVARTRARVVATSSCGWSLARRVAGTAPGAERCGGRCHPGDARWCRRGR